MVAAFIDHSALRILIPPAIERAKMQTGISDAKFVYNALTDPKSSLRLLKVLPERADDGHVQVYLWEDADGAAPYKCLSYTWGDQSQTYPIRLNGQVMQVGRNLHEFLEAAASLYVGETLWIDALCIDQSDDVDKSLQVQRMGEIFKNATDVLVWLGKHDRIEQLFELVDESGKIDKHGVGAMSKASLREILSADLAEHPYWNRAWIVQELVLARHVTLLCGSVKTTHVALHRLISSCYSPDPELRKIRNLLFGVWKHQRVVPFWFIFYQRGSELKCFNPRDRIYGLLSLTGHTDFKVDYSESVINMFWRSANHFLAWRCPYLLTLFWHALSVDQNMIDDAAKDIDLEYRVAIPLRTVKVTRSWLGLGLNKKCRQRGGGYNRAHIKRCKASDVVLCPSTDKRSGFDPNDPEKGDEEYRAGFDRENVHVRIRPLDDNGPGGEFSISLETHSFGTIPYSKEMQLYYTEGDKESRVLQWKELSRLAGLCQDDDNYGDTWTSRPHFILKTSHHYLLACVHFISAQDRAAIKKNLKALERRCVLSIGPGGMAALSSARPLPLSSTITI